MVQMHISRLKRRWNRTWKPWFSGSLLNLWMYEKVKTIILPQVLQCKLEIDFTWVPPRLAAAVRVVTLWKQAPLPEEGKKKLDTSRKLMQVRVGWFWVEFLRDWCAELWSKLPLFSYKRGWSLMLGSLFVDFVFCWSFFRSVNLLDENPFWGTFSSFWSFF